jgi:hypothetical protein
LILGTFASSVLTATTCAHAQSNAGGGATGLTLDLSSALQEAARLDPAARLHDGSQQPGDHPSTPQEPGAEKPVETQGAGELAAPGHPRFCTSGSSWLTLGLGYSNDLGEDQAGEVHASYSRFLDDDLEFVVELSGWYFDQRGDNTGGINPTMNLRWHFLHADDYDWTVYGDIGIGFLFAFDNVPDGGTGFNFTPRAGGGITKALWDDETRLQLGVRWAHISNGRIEGSERNPGRDSLMVYAGIIFLLP